MVESLMLIPCVALGGVNAPPRPSYNSLLFNIYAAPSPQAQLLGKVGDPS